MSMTIKIYNKDNDNANCSDFIDGETMFLVNNRNIKMNDPEVSFLDFLIEE